MRNRRGFSLAELVIAVALLAIMILGVMALSISVLKTERKANDLTAGKLVAQSVMSQLLDKLRSDTPAGVRATFMAYNTANVAFDSGTVVVQRTSYQYNVFVSTVTDSAGNPVGGALSSNRLKNVEIQVSWWNGAAQNRAGYGSLKTSLSQLVAEGQL
ncbi:hypothetical protein ABS71_07660 [bacterium SCN 62-11]|nr:MAG: hypothetical protein ABS71_07660 [bacterium SCN 62-11]